MEDLVDYLRGKGIQVYKAAGHEITTHCWFCPDGDPKGKGKWYGNTETWLWDCKRCGTQGGRKMLMEHFGDKDDDSTYIPGANPAARRKVLTEYTELAAEMLAQNEAMTLYLLRRGLDGDTILKGRIGYVPRGFSTCKSLPTEHSIADLRASGMLTDTGREFHQGKITIPYLSRGSVLQVRGKDPEGKYFTPTGDNVRLYNEDVLRGADYVIITEGEFDCLILEQWLSTAADPRTRRIVVVGVAGAGAWPGGKEGFPDYFRDAKRVYIGFDPDDTGRRDSKKLKEALGSKARIIELPDDGLVDSRGNLVKCDWTEFLRPKDADHPYGGHTLKDVVELVDRAEMLGKRLYSMREAVSVWRREQLEAPGMKTGLIGLDSILNPGLKPGNLFIPLAKTGVGKGHVLTEDVATPDGWVKWGDLKVGDLVFGRDGAPTRVTGVYDRGVLPTYRVRFSDHSSVVVDGDHIWCVRQRTGKYSTWVESTMTTSELVQSDLRRAGGWRFTIPMVGALQYPEADLPVDPYTLGALIANGSMLGTSAVLTTPDEHVVERVRRSYQMEWNERSDGACRRGVVRGVIGVIRRMGLDCHSREKFIPTAYLAASAEQRLALLQGLMDGDGSARDSGRSSVMYHTTSRALARDVRELVTSLGGTANVRWYARPRGEEAQIGIMLTADPFSTPAKRSGTPRKHTEPRRAIVAIEREADQEIRCISVDAEDRLYVVGRDHIVTHNTVFLANLAYNMRSHRTLFISLEQMTSEITEMVLRIHRFRNPLAEPEELAMAMPWTAIVDENRLSTDDFAMLVEEYIEQYGERPELVMVDYLGYYARGFRGSSSYERAGAAVMQLKAEGKNHRVSVIAPHQVSRGAQEGKAFEAGDARDSGVIEETGDFVIGLFKPDDAIDTATPGMVTGALNAKVLKSRRGNKNKIVPLQFSAASLAIVDAHDRRMVARVEQENAAINQGKTYHQVLKDQQEVEHQKRQVQLRLVGAS